jgi:DNA-binding HxlR family transcriptional regulator
MMGRRRFSEFLETGEGIPTNVLTERLQRLETAGLVTRSQYQDRPPRFEYQLTPAGAELGPVLGAIWKWGRSHVAGLGETAGETTVRQREDYGKTTGETTVRRREDTGENIGETSVRLRED